MVLSPQVVTFVRHYGARWIQPHTADEKRENAGYRLKWVPFLESDSVLIFFLEPVAMPRFGVWLRCGSQLSSNDIVSESTGEPLLYSTESGIWLVSCDFKLSLLLLVHITITKNCHLSKKFIVTYSACLDISAFVFVSSLLRCAHKPAVLVLIALLLFCNCSSISSKALSLLFRLW